MLERSWGKASNHLLTQRSWVQSLLQLNDMCGGNAAQEPMLGKFRYVGKPDLQHRSSTAAVRCVVHMFVMHVAEELRTWPEQGQRQRYWVSLFIPSDVLYQASVGQQLARSALKLILAAWLVIPKQVESEALCSQNGIIS